MISTANDAATTVDMVFAAGAIIGRTLFTEPRHVYVRDGWAPSFTERRKAGLPNRDPGWTNDIGQANGYEPTISSAADLEMRTVVLLLSVLSVAGNAHAAGIAERDAVNAFAKVCLTASESSKPARDLALAAGYKPDAAAPAGVARVFPLARLSASFTVPTTDGDVHILSTVMPPPATPFSCAVTIKDHGADLEPLLIAQLAASGYAANRIVDQGPARMLDFQKTTGDAIDRVLGLIPQDEAAGGEAILVAFRVQGGG